MVWVMKMFMIFQLKFLIHLVFLCLHLLLQTLVYPYLIFKMFG